MTKTNLLHLAALTQLTGDPFADAGGLVISFLSRLPECRDKNIMGLIEYATDIYLDQWDAKLHPFFLNSPITQPAFVGERKRTETIAYFQRMLDEDAPGKIGRCEISGKKTKVYPAGRNNMILGGSGTFVNYHAGMRPGIYLSREILIRMYFVPLGVHRLADKLALIVSNNQQAGEFFVFQNCIRNISAVKNNTSEGPLKSIFRNPANALFKFIDDYCHQRGTDNSTLVAHPVGRISTSLSLWHFSNLGQNPEVALYSMDSEIFDFYSYCHGSYQEDWSAFIRAHYNPDKLKKVYFDHADGQWKTKQGEQVSFEDYAKSKNLVLNALLNNSSLLRYFLDWSKTSYFPLSVIQHYQIKIRGMKSETVLKIEALADFIVSLNLCDQTIEDLNNALSRNELRKIFVKIQALAYREKASAVMLSAQDYADQLFQQGASWREVRDLFTISLYQKNMI